MRRLPLSLLVAGMLVWLTGCTRQEQQQPYQVFSGRVKALDVETGELFVRPDEAPRPWRSDRNVPCVVTKDSEIYINDRFSDIDDIRVGDRLELVGYRDADRFVVTFAEISRAQRPPPEPNLQPPATAPAGAAP